MIARVGHAGTSPFLRSLRPLLDLFYAGTLDPPAGWRESVDRYGWAVLYAGADLSAADTGEVTGASLRDAAAAGTLVGARLPIAWTTR